LKEVVNSHAQKYRTKLQIIPAWKVTGREGGTKQKCAGFQEGVAKIQVMVKTMSALNKTQSDIQAKVHGKRPRGTHRSGEDCGNTP
jgi:hypothetical protein